MRYKHCIFDLYGTLVDIHTEERDPALWQGLARYYASFGAAYTPEELMDHYFALVECEEAKLGATAGDTHESHPEIQLEPVFAALFTEKGVAADAAMAVAAGRQFRALSMEYIRLYDGAKQMLTALHSSGRKVWLLSNAQRMFTAYEMDRLGITECFDGIYLSSDYGCKKPDSRFFRVLLEQQHIDSADAIMVGNDGRCDIGGAKAVGLATLYIRSNISPKEPLPKADFVLTEMDIPRVQHILMEE